MHPTCIENQLNPTPSKPTLEWGKWVVEELTGMYVGSSSSALGDVLFTLGMEQHYTRNQIARFIGAKTKTLNDKMERLRHSVAESHNCRFAMYVFGAEMPDRIK
jgi:hypothetical protein